MTYVQMIERILDEVRSGKNVCALFYGHPGVFVTPSHNAIAIARKEGFEATMLPAVSAEDCLYADLGVDPSIPGLQIYEATDFLLRRRKVDTTVNLVLFQVGCVGELGFKFGGYSNGKFGVLVDYLEELYGPEHVVVNYVANVFAGDPIIDRHTVTEYRDPRVAAKVSGVSTFFIEAADSAVSDPVMSRKLGLKAVGVGRSTPLVCDLPAYPELAARAKIANRDHQVPPGYKFSFASEELYQTLLDLLLSPDDSRAFHADPQAFVASRQGLSAEERKKLLLEHHGVTRMMFKRDPQQEAVRFVGAALLDCQLAAAYRDQQHATKKDYDVGTLSPSEYEGHITGWLLDKGYATTASAISHAMKGVL